MSWAAIGMSTSSQVESALGLVASEKEKEELERKMDVRIVSVEK
jgi:hypothetical protein